MILDFMNMKFPPMLTNYLLWSYFLHINSWKSSHVINSCGLMHRFVLLSTCSIQTFSLELWKCQSHCEITKDHAAIISSCLCEEEGEMVDAHFSSCKWSAINGIKRTQDTNNCGHSHRFSIFGIYTHTLMPSNKQKKKRPVIVHKTLQDIRCFFSGESTLTSSESYHPV